MYAQTTAGRRYLRHWYWGLQDDVVKKEGKPNDLISRIKATKFFEPIKDDIDSMLDPKNFIGRSPEQVVRYCEDGGPVQKALGPYKKHIDNSKAVELTL